MNLLKSCEFRSTFVPNTGRDSIAPLKLRRLSMVPLNCLRFLFPLNHLLDLPPFPVELVLLFGLALLLAVPSGVGVAFAVGVVPDVLLVMFQVCWYSVGMPTVDDNTDSFSDLCYYGLVSVFTN